MGISSLPAPSESVLILLVANTAVTISILKEIIGSLLHFLGVRAPDPGPDHLPETPYCFPSEPSATERFRNRFKPLRFGSAAGRRQRHADCRVCLSRFEADSVVNRLACGHLFHRTCLEKWLDYHHVTCPLCRTHLLPGDDSDPSAADTAGATSWPWF